MMELGGIFLALFLSAYFSGSEIAFTALNPLQVQIWLKKSKRGARLAEHYQQHPDQFLITTLIGNNLSNIAYTSLATIWFLRAGWHEWISFLLISLVVLIFGEIVPKLVFHESTNTIFRILAIFSRIFHWLFYPFVWLISEVTSRLLYNSEYNSDDGLSRLRGHLHVLFSEAESAGHLDELESRMLKSTLELN